MGPALRVSLRAGYRDRTVLHNVRFELDRGERLGLLGTSGAGKSTLLLAMLGLLPLRGGWATGEVFIGGKNILAMGKRESRTLRGRDLALVPQSPLSALNPALSLMKHFSAAWNAHRQRDPRLLRERMSELFERVGLPSGTDFTDRKPTEISVGQAQRCTLALALLHRPSVLIADEPTSSLDPVTQSEVIDLLKEISEEQQAALLFVSHDLLSVFRLCSSVAILSAGHLSESMPLQEVPHTHHPGLRSLLDALPLPAEVLLQ